jgi:hypothetical protein
VAAPEGVAAAAAHGTEPHAPGAHLRRGQSLLVLGVLGVLVAVNLPELGSDPWGFRTPAAEPRGVLAPLVRASGGEWDPGLLRTAAVLAGLLVAVAAGVALSVRSLHRAVVGAVVVATLALLLLPATLLQAGLRHATAPWFHANDSTYQIEIAGELVRGGVSPYGHDYSDSGLERFYSLDGSVAPGTRSSQVALRHFAYFPGTPLSAAAWGLLPAPFDDYRFLVVLLTLAALPAALLFPGPLAPRLALGAALAANPLAVRAAWFGTADAPAVLALVVAFALLMRRRATAAAAALAVAILLKQFAVVAAPFFAVLLLRRVPRSALRPAAAVFTGVLAIGFLPFLVAGAGNFVADTIAYGGATYRIIGYGLAGLLLEAGAIDDRFGAYPFALLVVVVWLPLTVWLVRVQLRSPAAWTAAAAFAASIFVLFFLGRVFQTSYLVWPLAATMLAGLLAVAERARDPGEGGRGTEPGASRERETSSPTPAGGAAQPHLDAPGRPA